MHNFHNNFQTRNAADAFGPSSILMQSRLASQKSVEFSSIKPLVHSLQGEATTTRPIDSIKDVEIK